MKVVGQNKFPKVIDLPRCYVRVLFTHKHKEMA